MGIAPTSRQTSSVSDNERDSESWPRTDCCTGKGNTTAYDRAVWYPINNTQDLHNYTTVWTADRIQWYVDNKVVRTLNYNDSIALNGKTYPQTPMTVRLGIWAGGDPTENPNGTVELSLIHI